LISLYLSFLPCLIGMGTKNYHITLPHLVELNLTRCPQVVYSMSKSQDTTTTKVLPLFPYIFIAYSTYMYLC
jgi:hypothetical protein